MGILGTNADTIFEINLVIQFILILFLAFGFYKRRTFSYHGRIMALATLLNLGATAFVMLPSLITYWGLIVANPTSPGNMITIVHVVVGSIAIVLGSLFSIRFLLAIRNSQPLACGTRRMMLSTLFLWLFALAGGISFFVFFYI
ncbi:MAG: hypothetical protein ACXADC_15725 [Candidatus Thorarchaeota archaeon]|jgi:hypothetical protein